ncbi:MAG: hypothetical protein LBV74_00560 [Tannerella sp.]|jgi:hypothetical protein|nr:hypothetical protein [Tannerella sp.]
MNKNILGAIVKNGLYVIGAIIGALGGYLYWHYIGCATGTCPITSSVIGTSVSGAILGSLVFGLFVKDKKTGNGSL